MNWSRGMLRAWIMFTVIWVGLSATKLVSDWPVKGSSPYKPVDLSPNDPFAKYAVVSLTETYNHDVRERLVEFAERGLTAPAILLAIGLAIAWVMRGFKSGATGRSIE